MSDGTLCPSFSRGTGNGMAEAMQLEGYLMKEKSKLSLLHGLTGDVNKRYFRIRNIEVGAWHVGTYCM